MSLESVAIQRLITAAEISEFYYQKPLMIAYSGGKDSEVCLELAKRSGVPFEVVHSLTTADAPETIRHIRQKFYELELSGISCEIVSPKYKGAPVSMWSLIPQKHMPPTRCIRYCCSVLKESVGKNRVVVIGSRAAESSLRSQNAVAEKMGRTKSGREKFDFDNNDSRIIEPCQMKAKIRLHPILEWEHRDVWGFLREAKTKTNPVYEMGFHRCGCVGCPMAGKRRHEEFRVWPQYKNLYYSAFGRMLTSRQNHNLDSVWKNADEVWRWWMEDKNLDGQMSLFQEEYTIAA